MVEPSTELLLCTRNFLSASGEMTEDHCVYKTWRDFPGGPVAKTLCSQCWEPGFDLWLGN